MRAIVWCSFLTATLLIGTGCKKTEARDKAVESVTKAGEDIKALTEGELTAARASFKTTVDDRYAKLDTRITAIEAKTDARSKETAVALRARRDQLKPELDKIETQTASTWSHFKANVTTTIDTLEKDIDDASK